MSDSEDELDRTAEVVSSSSSSSDSDEGDYKDIDDAQIKLAQMRRAAKEKGANRLRNKLEGLKSYDELLREHANQRMKEGLAAILMMHTAAELSSICGVLGLKTLQKGNDSLDQLINYVCPEGQVVDELVDKVMENMWEGALIEYLRTIGHPVHTQFTDPKITIHQVWHGGGIVQKQNVFTPHFVRREVKKRYTWVQGDDIKNRLGELNYFQEKVKIAEKKVISDPAYTNILTYFQMMSELRSKENSSREYFIAELEQARGRLNSQTHTFKMTQDELGECEELSVNIVNDLNNKLAVCESMTTSYIKERNKVESDLMRLTSIIDSYQKTLEYRSRPRESVEEENEEEEDEDAPKVGEVLPFTFDDVESSIPVMKGVIEKMETLFKFIVSENEGLKKRASDHVSEIKRLESYIRATESRLSDAYQVQHESNLALAELKKQLYEANARVVQRDVNGVNVAVNSWGLANKYKLELWEIKNRMRVASPLVIAGMKHYHPLVSSVCTTIMNKVGLLPEEDIKIVYEGIAMEKEDAFSKKLSKTKKAAAKGGKSKPNTPGNKSRGEKSLDESASKASLDSTSKSTAKKGDGKKDGEKGKGKKEADAKADAKGAVGKGGKDKKETPKKEDKKETPKKEDKKETPKKEAPKKDDKKKKK